MGWDWQGLERKGMVLMWPRGMNLKWIGQERNGQEMPGKEINGFIVAVRHES